MRNFRFFSIFLIIFASQLSFAQPFEQAPKLQKKVNKIVEWNRSDFKEEGVKGFISEFNRLGKLTAYYQDGTPKKERLNYEYDAKGRLLKSTEGEGVSRLVTQYIYGKNKKSTVETFRGKVYQTHTFYNKKNQPIEQKAYLKGGELGTKFILKDRVLYHYKKDSLSGETHYVYALQGKGRGKKFSKRSIVYELHPKTKKKVKRKEFDFDGSVLSETIYSYDKQGRSQFVLYQFLLDQSKRSIEYKYKANKIWQIIEQVNNKRFVKIFNDGRLIRLRTYFGNKIFSITDYQYVYY